MTISVFLSHSRVDKPFVRRLAQDLSNHGINCWLDEAELNVGDNLTEKITNELEKVRYLAVVLSPDSVVSPWVKLEVDVALSWEAANKQIKVLPILYRHCEAPEVLSERLYADFTEESKYKEEFERLVRSMGVVFNRRVFEATSNSTLSQAIDGAINLNLHLFSKPFHRPFQYVGMTVPAAAKEAGHAPNAIGNIIIDNDECHMLLEAEGNFITYVEVDLKKTAPFYMTQEFDSEPILGAFSINPAELDLKQKQTHCHTYYDHGKKLKITVSCIDDGGPLSLGIGSKYYGN